MASQADRLLAELQKGSLSTLEIRATLDIPHPAGRVMDLIRHGYKITTHIVSEQGHKNVARYVLQQGGSHE